MSFGIDTLLEDFDADAAVGGEEFFTGLAMVEIGVDHFLDHIGHVFGGEGRAQDVAYAGVMAGGAAQGHLVELFAFLVDTQNADIADMVMAAGIHAAGDVQVQLADVVDHVQVVETTLYGFGDGNGLGIGQRAEVAAGAGDDIGEETDIGGVEAQLAQFTPCLLYTSPSPRD